MVISREWDTLNFCWKYTQVKSLMYGIGIKNLPCTDSLDSSELLFWYENGKNIEWFKLSGFSARHIYITFIWNNPCEKYQAHRRFEPRPSTWRVAALPIKLAGFSIPHELLNTYTLHLTYFTSQILPIAISAHPSPRGYKGGTASD